MSSDKATRYAPKPPPGMSLADEPPRGPEPPLPEPGSYKYEVLSSYDPDTGTHYPLLDGLNRHWYIITQELDQLDEAINPHFTFGLPEPTLQIVHDDGVTSLYVDGLTQEEFCQRTGLRLHPEVKGPLVMSKRLSRVLRPYFLSDSFDPESVKIAYMDEFDYANYSTVDPTAGPKVWDGAGVVSRRMLKRMLIDEENMSPAKAARLRRELARTDRVEFTIMTDRGQDKGHAMVADEIVIDGEEHDFLLPQDTKREISLHSGQTWVGFDFVHGKDHMRIDIQSAIDLHPFFNHEQYAEWLHDAGEVFSRAVESGDVVAAMARVDKHDSLDDIESYGTRLFFASGGHPMHFRHHAKSLMNQRINQLNTGAMHKHRIDIPGGRYYVMPQAVGEACGYEGIAVEPGEVQIDHQRGTAWVNDEDWLSLPDSPDESGIAAILGGADHDDALWMHVFDDYDGDQKVLAWRSPNQLGEYVVLKPTANSNLPTWETADGEIITSVPGDSRTLPTRIDHRQITYTQRVDHDNTVSTMEEAIQRVQANSGALGMTCNTLMVTKAVYGDLPEEMPAPLEDIIDAQVKTGADTSHIVQWNYDYIRRLLESGTPVPKLLIGDPDQEIKKRLSIDYSDRDNLPPLPRASSDHWLDHTVDAVLAHVAQFEEKRDTLMAQAIPPRQVFDSVFDDPEAIELGKDFNSTYTRILRTSHNDYDRAREECEAFLDRHPPERQNAILRGAIFSSYLHADERGHSRSDAAVWQKGRIDPKTNKRGRGVEHRTIEALREIGVLDELGETSEGLMVYPGAVIDEAPVRTLGLQDVWLNFYKTQCRAQGKAVPEGSRREQMRQVPKKTNRDLKDIIKERTATSFRDKILQVAHNDEGQLVAYNEYGDLFGTLQHAEDLQPGDRIQLLHSLADDGNLRATYSVLPAQDEQPE